ncbi:dihydrodipicolinate synthase family protein [Caballeronia sp. INDeC2]|uniref:dihydrodipicolinate synthase family protein n=1 Tax=Caballeronia sp. INDeC2 TaxID=2921747 RepID=UPI0020292ECB|nr:dihydrodipicolinate synthase family protein [Caballeronia sp. INDeC2]
MQGTKWSGVFTALATPYSSNGDIEWGQLRELIDLLLVDGVNGFVVAGSTGEYYSQSADERKELFRNVKKHVGERATLIAGTSSLSATETFALTQEAKQIGFDGCMVLPPVYCLPTFAETRRYFEQVAAIGLPIMIYNNPARVGVGLSPAQTAELASIPNVAAYKESARDLYAIAETYYATRDRLAHFAGLEPYASALLSRGASGIVSTISNLCAREVVNYYKAFRANDAEAVSRNQQVIDQLYHLLAHSGLSSFAFVKTAMSTLGRPGGVTRAPHIMGSDEQTPQIGEAVRQIYARAGIALQR